MFPCFPGSHLKVGYRYRLLTYIFAGNCLAHIIRRGAQKLGNHRELMDMVFPGKQRLALYHLGEDACCAPDIYFCIILPPCEHDLRCTVVSGCNISGHLGVLNAGKSKVANLEVAIFIDEDIAGLEITVNNAC